ncbi:uncharacterized protein LOC135481708, partial [Liolophura sinensis]|uniref:uncharacterized protein LOC135481708 n=1 Tax=Liolophura sinensis TaxID=3198878 RepID=UPI003159712D
MSQAFSFVLEWDTGVALESRIQVWSWGVGYGCGPGEWDTDICRRFSLPCTPGDRLADPSTCRQYYECGHDGLYLMKRECPPTTGYDYQRGGCRRVVDFQCVSPVKCPTNIWGESDKSKQTDNFPTELVIGGTLGSLSLLTIFLLVVACIRKWRIENESRRLRKMRRTLRSHRLPPVLDNPHFLHMDKVTSIYQKLNDN